MSQAPAKAESPTPGPRLQLIGLPQLQAAPGAVAQPLDRIVAALLAWLVLEGCSHRDRLLGLLWPGTRASDPGVNLRQWRRRLAALAGQPVLAGTDWISLAPGVTHDLGPMSAPQPLAMPAGELLGSFAYADEPELGAWVESQRSRWRAGVRLQQQQALDALARQGRWDEAIVQAETMLLQDRHAEDAYLRVARLYWKRGDRAGAQAVVARCRAALAADQVFQLGPEMAELATLLAHHGTQAPPPELPLPPTWLLSPPRLVGRVAEWRALHAAWRAGRAVCLDGEEGSGKTRFIDAVAAAHPGAVRVAAAPGDRGLPDALLRRVLRTAAAPVLADCPPALRAELARLLPELGPASPLPAYRPRLGEAVRAALQQAQERGLSALLLDDVQWADAGSLALLQALAEDLGPAGPAWLLGCRSGERPAALQAWPALAEGRAIVLPLGGLARDAVAELLATLGWPPGRALAWAGPLHERTLGNPRALLETLVALQQRDGDAALQAECPAPACWPAPEALVQGVQARLRRLSRRAQALAQLAALAGSGLSVALAQAVLQDEEASLRSAWHELEQAQLLREQQLASPWLAAAVRGDMPLAFACALHARIAAAGRRLGWAAARVAHQEAQAGRPAQAASEFERAAAEARSRNDRHGEIDLLDRAAACHDLEGQGDAAFAARATALQAAMPVLSRDATEARAAELCRLARSPAQQLLAATAKALWATTNMRREGLDALAAGIESLLDAPTLQADLLPRLRAWGAAAAALALTAQTDAALRALAAGDALAGQLQAAPATAAEDHAAWQLEHVGIRSFVLNCLGQHEPAQRAMNQAYRLAEDRDDWAEAMTHAGNLVVAAARQGDFEQAWRWSARAASYRQRLGAERGAAAAQARMNHGVASLRTGRYGEALQELEAARAILLADAPSVWLITCENHLAILWLELGQAERAQAALATPAMPDTGGFLMRRGVQALLLQDEAARGAAWRAALDDPWPEAPAIRGLWQLYWASTLPPEEAIRVCTEVEALCQAQQLPSLHSHVRLRLAQAASRLGEHARAQPLLAQVLDGLPTCRPMQLSLPMVWALAAEVHRAAGRDGDAREASRRGLAWIDDVALPHVPAQWRESFQHGNPLHQALQAQAGLGDAGAG